MGIQTMMWRTANILVGLTVLALTAMLTAFGVTRKPADAERLLEAALSAFLVGSCTLPAIMVLLAALALPWDLRALIQEQRALRTPLDSWRYFKRKFLDAAALRHSPRRRDKAQAVLMTAYLWIFIAMMALFIPMVATIASCPEC